MSTLEMAMPWVAIASRDRVEVEARERVVDCCWCAKEGLVAGAAWLAARKHVVYYLKSLDRAKRRGPVYEEGGGRG